MTEPSPRPFFITAAVALMLLCIPSAVLAQNSADALWSEADDALLRDVTERDIVPEHYRTLALDGLRLEQMLTAAPLEDTSGRTLARRGNDVVVSLPLPDGEFGRFAVFESPIMEAGLAAKFPQIKTYRGQGIDDPLATARFDRTPAGFHAMILSPAGSVYIDPYGRGDSNHYISYWAQDARRSGPAFSCGVTGHNASPDVAKYRASKTWAANAVVPSGVSGTTLRTYRAAVAATGEYTAFHGGTVPLGQAAIVTAMNRVNGVYEMEVAIRMVLVANNDQIVYTNAITDPYTNDDGPTMLGENQTNLDAVIGSASYDIGHVFSTGGGGVATLQSPCNNGSKARGVTGLGSPIGDPFWIDFVAHEMGHQWGGNHTFNGDDGNCAGGNRNGSTAYEPGSGTTIQAYAGICGTQNLQPGSDPYFHGISLDEIIAYSTVGNGNNCAVPTPTGNNPPTVDAGAAFTVPLATPFELCGSATDPEVDPLTYGWEQFDLGPAGAPGSPVGNAPIFRSFNPTASACRTFPRMSDLAAGTAVIGELLPTYARTMNFRLTARDNRSGGGGVNDDATVVTISAAAGPFQVTAPNTAVSLAQGSATTVTWDVAATDQAPINCATADIFLSTDGGLSYPTTLAAGVANSGSQSVTLPNLAVFSARVQVRCASSIFFDISDVDFGIGVPVVVISAPLAGSTVVSGDPVTFTGTAADPEDGDLAAGLSWTSSLDGPIGSGASFQNSTLSLGTHTITASVTDANTNTAMAVITIQVEPACVALLYSASYEIDNDGWVEGASTCTTGNFIRGTPDEASDGIITQPAGAATGSFAWFTQNNAGGAGVEDVDGGTCETLSPAVTVGAGSQVSAFVDYFHGQRDSGDDPEDGFSIELIDANSNNLLATLVSIGDVANAAVWNGVWAQQEAAPATVRLRVRATDGAAGGDLIEGGIDNVRICVGVSPFIFGDSFE